MSQKIFVSALIAGAVAGLLAAVLQFAFVVPLLLEGELYETGLRVHFFEGTAQSEAGSPPLGWDFQRHSLTLAYSMITWIAFGLILMAGMAIAATRGHEINAQSGAIWGIMAFFAVQLAPAVGLPPELPGTPAPEVGPRQFWWAATIITAIAAFAMLAFRPGVPAILVAAVLLLAPHVYGAPHLDTYFGVSPPELSAVYVTRSLAVVAVVWVSMGAVAGWIWSRD